MTAASHSQPCLARSILAAPRARTLLSGLFRLAALAGLVIVGTGTAQAATAARAKFGSAWQSVDCKTFDVPAAVAARSDCGYVTAPEQHALPKGRTIQLAVVRMRSTSKSPAADPLFVEQGGPGDSTIGVIVDWAVPTLPELQAVLKSRDLVFVEERGTRYSRPFLSCPEYDARVTARPPGARARAGAGAGKLQQFVLDSIGRSV